MASGSSGDPSVRRAGGNDSLQEAANLILQAVNMISQPAAGGTSGHGSTYQRGTETVTDRTDLSGRTNQSRTQPVRVGR